MNTPRPSSRNQRALSNGSSAAPPRRAKVPSVTQMEISSATYSPKSAPLSGSTPTNSSRVPNSNGLYNGNSSYGNNYASSNGNNYASSNGNNANYSNNNNNSNINLVRAPPVRVRTSNPGGSTTSSRISNGTSVGGGSSNGGSRKDGSVTSDDGTISEDSDLTRDDMLFSGGEAGINFPFVASNRPTSANGSLYSTGPKIAMQGGGGGTGGLPRHRSSSSIIGLSSGSSVGGANPKPRRMAVGASIKADSSNTGNHTSTSSSHSSLGVSSTSATMPVWSTSNSPSLSRNGSLRSSGGGGDDGSSTISANSTNPNQPTIRSAKTGGNAANKQADENRRAEEAARTKRKIQDLEISNNSLLSLNQSLEATNKKMVSEIQELKMRIQSAHFGELGYTAADLALAQSVDAIELTEEERNDDLTFKRLCLSIEHMVLEAKQALDQTKSSGVRVLSLYEMYEKEAAEETEEDDLEEEDNHSVTQDQQEDLYSLEVIDQDDEDSSSKEEMDRDSDDNDVLTSTLGNSLMISAPLTMVV
ncbi:hypothetical protein BGX27_008646 [Mortierella sp. AM989]|nr:hypothetical protein BGX27_008646 [Mortierella sp. AM989]